jgi:hypothetical protein
MEFYRLHRLRYCGLWPFALLCSIRPQSGSEAEGSACGLIRGTSPTAALKDRAILRNDLTSAVRDSNILRPEYET